MQNSPSEGSLGAHKNVKFPMRVPSLLVLMNSSAVSESVLISEVSY